MLECTVRWNSHGMSFIAETGSGHIVAMDGAPEAGGRNLAPRPMELLLAGAGGCTSFDIVSILKKAVKPSPTAPYASQRNVLRRTPRFSPASTCISSFRGAI